MTGLNKSQYLICALLMLHGTEVIASDGVLEISHACATNMGCFSGDAEGYPITIDGSAGSSYQLTSNIISPDAETDGIKVISPDISIDLNGFEISGPMPCSADGLVDCPPAGSGDGIDAVAGRVSLRNGFIVGLGGNGVVVGDGSDLSGLTIMGNAGSGVSIGTGGRISDCTIRDNGGEGIVSGEEGLIVNNVITGNVGLGLNLGDQAGFARNILNRNANGAEQAQGGVLLSDNVCPGNACTGCPVALVDCAAQCVDLATDVNNCGGCGVACNAGAACTSGICVLSCPPGQTDCGGICVDTAIDESNCGGCSSSCFAGQICSSGACEVNCQITQTNCGGICVDTAIDESNCGGCGLACGPGELCTSGNCSLSCPAGLVACGGACSDLASDENNCGGCGVSCGSGESCVAGACS